MVNTLSELAELIDGKDNQILELRENLDRLEGMIDRNWRPLMGTYDDTEGPSLDQLKEAAARNREMMALNPHVGNGLELINSYVWADGVHYEGVPGRRQGKGTNVQGIIDNPINQENFFGRLARKQRQTAFYCDGLVFYYGDDRDMTVHQVSIMEITDDYRNPDKSDEIWAYRRTWTRHTTSGAAGEQKSEWVFVNRFLDKRGAAKTINYNGVNEPIAIQKRMFVKKSNPVVGWAYGLSDVQRGIAHAEDYRIAMKNGESMTASMASIWATAKNNSTTGAQAAAVTAGNMTGAGGLAHIGQNNAMQVLPSAGQAYKFQDLLPILANFAAGIGVSVIALSMNSGNAGGSYGAARSLDRPEQLSTKNRREYNAELDREVLLWMGAPGDKLDVWFDPITSDEEIYRGVQGVLLEWGSGLYGPDEIKRKLENIHGVEKTLPVPDGVMLPNNEKSVNRRDVDPNVSGTSQASNGGGMTPTQGSGASVLPTGSGDQRADDIRTRSD